MITLRTTASANPSGTHANPSRELHVSLSIKPFDYINPVDDSCSSGKHHDLNDICPYFKISDFVGVYLSKNAARSTKYNQTKTFDPPAQGVASCVFGVWISSYFDIHLLRLA